MPEVDDLEKGQVVRLDGETVDVLNLVDRKRWLVRRAACGETCCCAAQGWPADHDEAILPPDPYLALSLFATSETEFTRLRRLERSGERA